MLVARVEVLGEVDARGGIRFTVDQDSVARGMNGLPVDVVVENFSRTGFLFVADVDFPVNTLVTIGLAGAGAREAMIVRRDGRRHGCEFLVPLAHRDIAHAFRGQDEIVSSLEAALARPYRATRTAPEGVASRPGRLKSWIAAARRWLRR